MMVDAHVRRSGVKVRRLDPRDCAPRRQVPDISRDIRPVRAAIFRVPDQTIVRARPNQTFLNFRGRDRKHDFAVELTEVVLDDAARRDDAARVLRREIGADGAPALTAVRSREDHLAAVIHLVVIEWIDGQRRRPVAAVL